MPDDFLPLPREELTPLLRSLPLLAPPRSAWPDLRRKLPAHRRFSRRHARLLLLAAALAIAALLPAWLAAPPIEPASRVAVETAPDDETRALQALMQESARLELWIGWSQSSAVETAPSASLGAGLGARLQQIDALLARGDLAGDARLPLWQERVLRLRQLAHIENTQQLLAAHGESDAGLPVLAF